MDLLHIGAPGGVTGQEEKRLAALERYDILDTQPEEAFDRITKLAARLLGMPISITGFIDETRHWFKAVVGVDMNENARAGSFCQYTIAQDGVLVVPDATKDGRFADLPVVKHGPARFYAGAPLTTQDGYSVGTLCVFDITPREGLDQNQTDVLLDLAYLLVDELELRSSAESLRKERDESERLRIELKQLNEKLEKRVEERTSELEHLNEQLQHDAFHDPLTGLANRALLLDRLEQVMQRQQQRPDGGSAVLFLDLDRFKLVNDSLGHGAGDLLLMALAKRLRDCVRPGDTVSRLGGDEFVVLLDPVDSLDGATRTAERVQRELARPFEIEGQMLHTSTSIGIVSDCADHGSAEAVLRDADLAMYQAKSLGKARHQVFTQAMRDRAVSLMSLENDLRKAIERDELRVFYQPVVSVATEEVTGFEALVRWEHPEHGLVSPAEFIPLAEETGLIVELDRWVLREACRQVKDWQHSMGQPNLTISVNLSGQQFDDPALAQHVSHVLTETDFSPTLLKLEITESMLMRKAEQTIETLTSLRALGVHIYVDDFGTGYSSLSYLQRFPVNTLKIDRAFVSQMLQSPESDTLIRTIITMADNLKLTVVAEGIESLEQLERLRSLKCGLAQGYFFAKPLRADEVAGFVGVTCSEAGTQRGVL